MPENVKEEVKPDYISTVYNNLKQAYGDGFDRTQEDFRTRMSTDFNYRKTVHANLKQAYGDNFKKDFNTFNYQLPSIPSKTEAPEAGLHETSIEDHDALNSSANKIIDDTKSIGLPDEKMPSETTQNVGGVYRAAKAQADKLKAFQEKQSQPTTKEFYAQQDPDLLKSDIHLASTAAAKLFEGKAQSPDALEYSKYLLNLKHDDPEKFNEQFDKLGKFAGTVSPKERYNMIQEGINYNAKKVNEDKDILTARGDELRFKEYSKITKQFDQLNKEVNAYANQSEIPEDKRSSMESRLESLKQQKEDFESDPKNQQAVENFGDIFDRYDNIIKAQNKVVTDTPEILKEQKDKKDIKRQEELIENNFKDANAEDVASGTYERAVNYHAKEALGNVWNTVLDAATGLMETSKDLASKINPLENDGDYSVMDRLVDQTKDFIGSHAKATLSDTDLFDAKGDIKWYRFGPNIAKVGTDMAIALTPVSRLAKLGQAMKLGKYADEAAAVASQWATTYDDYKNDAVAQGMSNDDAQAYGFATSLVTSLAAAVSPNEAILNPTAKQSLSNLAKTYAEKGVTGFTKKEGFTKLVKEITDVIGTSVKESAKEATQENLESVGEKIVNAAFNAQDKKNGVKMSEELTGNEIKANTVLAAALTAPATGIAQTASASKILDGATFELVKNYDETQKLMSEMKDNGRLSEDAYNNVTSQLEKTKELYDKIPDNFSDESKLNIMPILREKAGLEERVKRLDKTFAFRDHKRLSEIDKTLNAFNEKESAEPAKPEEKGNAEPADQQNNSSSKIVPLSDDEISNVKENQEVHINEDGKAVPAIVKSFTNSGNEVVLEVGGKHKIVLTKNLVKEVPNENQSDDLNLSEEDLKALEKDDTDIKQQQKSDGEPGSDSWNLAVKNRLGKVFKGSDVSFNQEDFDKAAEASAHPNAKESNGFYDPATNKIYLNPSKVKKDTPVHEFGHIWADVLKEKDPKTYEKLIELSSKSDFYKQAESNDNYSHLSKNDLAEEAFVQALGKKGVDVFTDMSDKNHFTQFVGDMWDHVKNALGLNDFKINDNTSFSDVVQHAAEDLAKNKSVKLKRSEEEGIKQQNSQTKGFNEPVKEIANIAAEYAKEKGISDYKIPEKIAELDEDNAKKIADAFSEMKHNPEDEKVKNAYKKMADETVDQGKFILDKGYKVELYEGKGEPYKNSAEMLKDLSENKHMYVLSTKKDFGNEAITEESVKGNPLLAESSLKDSNGNPLLVNDVFRFVHDFFGHGKMGNQFGAVGEENAWNVHSKMYSDEARNAMTTETRGQNSFVNFGPHMRNKERQIIKKGEEGYLEPKARPFADQKVGLLPDWIYQGKKSYENPLIPEEKKIQDDLQKDLTDNYEERKKEYINENGLVFDTDKARTFSPAYKKNPELLSNATQIPAREFVSKMYKEELAKPAPEGKKEMVVFTAGGSGVGKSRAIENMKGLNNHMTVDTNLSNFERAKADINEALDHGKNVSIFFTFRDPLIAFTSKKGGVIERAKKVGRTVPFDVATSINEKSLSTIIKLSEHFKDNGNVHFSYYNNNFNRGEAKPMSIDDVKAIKVDFEGEKEKIKNELKKQYEEGKLNEDQYAGLIGDTKRIQDILGSGRVEQDGGPEVSGGLKFSFDQGSEVGKKLIDFVKKKLDAGVSEADIKKILKDKTGRSDKFIDDILKSAKQPVQKTEPFTKTETTQKNEQAPPKETKSKPEPEKIPQSTEVNDKIIDLSRVPVSDRANTVLGRVFNNPETPQTLIDTLTNRFGSRNAMLNSKRYSQVEARDLGKQIVKAFDNLKDAIDFARNPGTKIDSDIQAAILDNVISDAYEAEKKSTTNSDREYYKGIQADALDEIAKAGEESGRKISYYKMMYNMNPVIFGEKMADSISALHDAILEKKIGDTAKSATDKINDFAKKSKDVIETEKRKSSESKAVDRAINDNKKPKFKSPKTTKTEKEIAAIRKSRADLMKSIKGIFKNPNEGSTEKFSFEEESNLDPKRIEAIQQVGDTFIQEGYLNFNSWARKVQNEFKEAGITIYGKELQEAWGNLNEKVRAGIKEVYSSSSPEEVQSLIESQAKEKVKDSGQAIRDILADAEVSKDMKDKIKSRLMKELGLSEGYSTDIVDAFYKEFETQARKQVEAKLKEITNRGLITSRKKSTKQAEAKIVNDVLNGTVNGDDLKPSFYEMYGMKAVSQDTKERLVELSRKATIQSDRSLMKDKTMRDLYNEMQKYKPSTAFQLGTDAYYSSMLSGYETHIKNFALFNAMQVYINKPLQIAIQNMLSGNNSGAATAIFSKELNKFMFNEAKGIILTGTNAFYDTPHEQSHLESTVKNSKSPFRSIWRYSHLPLRFLSAEDAFGTLGLSEVKARQLLYDKIKSGLKDRGEDIIPEQINQEVDRMLGYTKENVDLAKIGAEQSLKNYYGEDFDLNKELSKKPENNPEKLRQESIKSEYNRELYREITKSRDSEVQDQAIAWAKEALLQNEPTGTMGRVYLAMNSVLQHLPVIRAFIPFLKVPLNVANNIIQSTPGTSYIRMFTKRKGVFGGQKMTAQEHREHVQKALGYTLLIGALAALQEGLRDKDDKPFFYVTGKNGKSYTESIARENAGIDQPYTVYVGGKPLLKYQYTPWMPMFAALGIANDIRLENGGEMPEDKINSTMAANVFIKYANTISEQAALKGMNEIFNLVQEGYDEFSKGKGNWGSKLNEFAAKKSAGIAKTLLIPNAATQANTDIKALFDADRIATTSYLDDIIKDMPLIDVISQQYFGNESKIDVLGRPIKEKFSVAGYSKVGDDKYYKLFVDKNYIPYSYNKRTIKIGAEDAEGNFKMIEKPLDLKQRYDANKMRGDLLLNYMNENMDELKELDPNSFGKKLKSVIGSFDKQVEKELFGDPDSQ